MARRAHSVAELRRKLQRRALSRSAVTRVLERLTASGVLDDGRFARSYARYRASSRRWGRLRLQRELRQRGVAEELIEEALAEVFPEPAEEVALVRQRLEKKFQQLTPPYSTRQLQAIYASLLRAGFPSAIIRQELFQRIRTRPARSDVHELDGQPGVRADESSDENEGL